MYLSNMFFVHSDFYYESCKPVRFTSEGTGCGYSFRKHNVLAKFHHIQMNNLGIIDTPFLWTCIRSITSFFFLLLFATSSVESYRNLK